MPKVILKTNHEFLRIISRLPDNAQIHASTFNISTWENHGPVHSILREFNIRHAHVVVGVPFFRNCTGDQGKGRCRSCYTKHNRSMMTLAKLRDQYTDIDWKFVTNLHAKFVVAGSLTITGGRNITDGDLADLSFAEKDPVLAEQLREIWGGYAAQAYDIGTKGPLVFTTPYKGELMADSSVISQQYREEASKSYPDSTEATFWKASS